MSGRPELKIDWATYEAAKYAVTHWHYSRSMPAGKMVKVGAWEDSKYIGAVLFAYGANQKIGSPYGLKQIEVCELVRVALTDHQTPVSRIIALSLKYLKKQSPGIRLVVSYADTGHGHHGGIYQATNWIYEGYFDGEHSVIVNGRTMHRRRAYSLFGTTRPKGSVNVPASGKHKYLMPLDDEMRKRIEPLRKPYPKRDKQAIGGDHPHSGGAAPTVTLQNNNEVPNAKKP